MKTCPKCGGDILSEKESQEREAFIKADHSIDCGEFSGGFDHYEDDCHCSENEDLDLSDDDFFDGAPEHNEPVRTPWEVAL
jgi:hypothetical protein